MSEQGPRTEAIDYVARWRDQIRSREEQGRRLDRLHDRDDPWAGARAKRFRQMTRQSGSADPLVELIRAELTPTTTVLDVGAGAGRHVVPVAPLVASVTAVEPSPAMRQQLDEVIREKGLTNVSVVAGGWPGAEVPSADVVICSHVTYFVEDIDGFLLRLREVTRRCGYLVHRHRQREQPFLELFQRIWGEPRLLEPTFADLFGASAQVEFFANVTAIPYSISITFDTLDEAVEVVRREILNPEGPRTDWVIRDYLNEHMVQRDGKWGFNPVPTFAGVLWWEAG